MLIQSKCQDITNKEVRDIGARLGPVGEWAGRRDTLEGGFGLLGGGDGRACVGVSVRVSGGVERNETRGAMASYDCLVNCEGGRDEMEVAVMLGTLTIVGRGGSPGRSGGRAWERKKGLNRLEAKKARIKGKRREHYPALLLV